jgi:Ca2+-dependent lipid-binding protein
MENMYCIQINKALKNLKKKSLTNNHQLFVEIDYHNQFRRTTTKHNIAPIWFESFLFVIDNDKDSEFKINIYQEDSKKNKLISSHVLKLHNSSIKKEQVKHLEIQHGILNHDKINIIYLLKQEVLSQKNMINDLKQSNNELKFDYLKYHNAFSKIKHIVYENQDDYLSE